MKGNRKEKKRGKVRRKEKEGESKKKGKRG